MLKLRKWHNIQYKGYNAMLHQADFWYFSVDKVTEMIAILWAMVFLDINLFGKI